MSVENLIPPPTMREYFFTEVLTGCRHRVWARNAIDARQVMAEDEPGTIVIMDGDEDDSPAPY